MIHAHTQKTLNERTCGCGRPECEAQGFVFAPQCHVNAATIVTYCREHRAVEIYCCVCKNIITAVKVAEG